MDRLGFWGRLLSRPAKNWFTISVSADGSTWFLGGEEFAGDRVAVAFQYPLMDRLGFWGHPRSVNTCHPVRFQYPLMDRLGFWGLVFRVRAGQHQYFSIR